MNAPVALAMPHRVRRARLSATDGVPVGDWAGEGEAANDAGEAATIDLWLFDLDEGAAPAADPIRRSEARAMAARRRLREVLGSALGRQGDAIELLVGPRGKPALRAPRTPPLFFNASRSGPLALIAVAPTEIGIDIERSLHRGRGDQGGRGGEAADWAQRLRHWTRREAVAKATGLGLGLRLRTPLGTHEGSVQFGGTLWGWRDVVLPADAHAVAAIAYREKGQRRCG